MSRLHRQGRGRLPLAPGARVLCAGAFRHAYTHNDLLALCDGQEALARVCFDCLNWQSPETWVDEQFHFGEWRAAHIAGAYTMPGITKLPALWWRRGMMAGMKLGQVVATRGVAERMRESSGFAAFVHRAFQRYLRADWGELCESDRKQNDRALAHGGDRILAAYTHPAHPEWKIWIITEWDGSATTLLFPDEY